MIRNLRIPEDLHQLPSQPPFTIPCLWIWRLNNILSQSHKSGWILTAGVSKIKDAFRLLRMWEWTNLTNGWRESNQLSLLLSIIWVWFCLKNWVIKHLQVFFGRITDISTLGFASLVFLFKKLGGVR